MNPCKFLCLEELTTDAKCSDLVRRSDDAISRPTMNKISKMLRVRDPCTIHGVENAILLNDKLVPDSTVEDPLEVTRRYGG